MDRRTDMQILAADELPAGAARGAIEAAYDQCTEDGQQVVIRDVGAGALAGFPCWPGRRDIC